MPKKAFQKRGSKTVSTLRMQRGERVFIGVDVHKSTYYVAAWSDARGLIATWVQPSDPQVLRSRLAIHAQHIEEVVYEAGPTGFALVRVLREAGFDAEVVAPSRIPSEPGIAAKCDRLDCRKLAQFAAKRLLHPVRVPSRQEETDRQIVRLREQLVQKKRCIRQQIKSFLLLHGISMPSGLNQWSRAAVEELKSVRLDEGLRYCLDVLLDELFHAEAQVKHVTSKVEELACTPRHRQTQALLRTVPMVGLITAMTFKTELFAPERFTNERQVAQIAGLAPQVRQSGNTRHEVGLGRAGNIRLRTILVEAAWRWVRNDPRAQERYRRLIANSGNAKKAIVGMARKLSIILWCISTRQEGYKAVA